MTLALDGSANGTNFFGSTQSVTLTTTNTNDVIIVDIQTSAGPVVAVTATGLTFTQHSTAYTGSSGIERWYAVATLPLTTTAILVSIGTNTGFIAVVAYGISGANTSTPFQVPVVTGNGTGIDPLSITATGNAFLVAQYITTNSAPTGGSGWTDLFDGIMSGENYLVEYQIVSSAGTYSATIGTGVGTASNGILDAIAPAGGGGDILYAQVWM